MRRPLLLGSAVLAAAALLLPVAPASAGALAASTVAPVTPVVPTPVLPPTEGPLPVVPKPKPVAPKPLAAKPKAIAAKPKAVAPKAKAWAPSWQGTLATGAAGPAVKAAQLRLTALGYWSGRPNGRYGAQTRQAVMALQKTAGLRRTGRIDQRVRKVLIAGTRPQARTKSGTTIEIDLRRQLLLVVVNGRTRWAVNTSTGSGRPYYQDGNRYIARTPRGRFAVTRQINGRRVSKLGVLWRPKYFSGGYAMHGSNSIPGYPASHGCVRLSNTAIDWLWSSGLAPVGRKVWIY